jgi:creatinine amidohydrolase
MSPEPVRWADLRPDQFLDRLAQRALVYLPMGLCEPHGTVAAFGLDTHLADWVCDRAAERFGGIVAPTQGYHVHETGFHARWLDDVVGEVAPRLGSLPPHVVCHQLLFQLRAFHNAGFAAVVVVTGHVGGSERDLEAWLGSFSRRFGLPGSVEGLAGLSGHRGDHAGRFELSALLHARPELVDLGGLAVQPDRHRLGRFALGDTAGEASAAYGAQVLEAAVDGLGRRLELLPVEPPPRSATLQIAPVEHLYRELTAGHRSWASTAPHPGQDPVEPGSPRRPYEHPDLGLGPVPAAAAAFSEDHHQ